MALSQSKHLAVQVAEAEAEEQERADQLAEQAKTVAAVTREAALARWRRLKVRQVEEFEGQGRLDSALPSGKQSQHSGGTTFSQVEITTPSPSAAQSALCLCKEGNSLHNCTSLCPRERHPKCHSSTSR